MHCLYLTTVFCLFVCFPDINMLYWCSNSLGHRIYFILLHTRNSKVQVAEETQVTTQANKAMYQGNKPGRNCSYHTSHTPSFVTKLYAPLFALSSPFSSQKSSLPSLGWERVVLSIYLVICNTCTSKWVVLCKIFQFVVLQKAQSYAIWANFNLTNSKSHNVLFNTLESDWAFIFDNMVLQKTCITSKIWDDKQMLTTMSSAPTKHCFFFLFWGVERWAGADGHSRAALIHPGFIICKGTMAMHFIHADRLCGTFSHYYGRRDVCLENTCTLFDH